MNHLTQDELKGLIRNISNPRWKLMIKVGFLHGLRVSEIISLKRENVWGGFIKVQRLKGSLKTVQPYVVHPDPELNEAEDLTALAGTLKPGELVFPITRFGVYKLIQRAGTRAGIPSHKLHPHTLKHTCAMVGIEAMGIHMVRQYLGHKSISSTGEYLKETDEAASHAFIGALK